MATLTTGIPYSTFHGSTKHYSPVTTSHCNLSVTKSWIQHVQCIYSGLVGHTCTYICVSPVKVCADILYSILHSLHPSPEERNAALISALSDILWKLGTRQGRAVVALPPSQTQHTARVPSRSYTPDHLTERVIEKTVMVGPDKQAISGQRLFRAS